MIVKTVTKDDIQKALPSRKNTVTDELVQIINEAARDPEFQGESLLQTMTTYENVMLNNRASIKEFANAVKFCAYLMTLDDNFTEAFKKVFSYRDFVKERLDAEPGSVKYNELSSAASRYRRSKLVVELLTMSQAPLDIMFMGWRYKALGVLAEVMTNSKLDKDKINAADKLLLHTASTTAKLEIDIGVKENSAVTNLAEQLAEVAVRQKKLLETGVTDLNTFGALKPKENIEEAEIV